MDKNESRPNMAYEKDKVEEKESNPSFGIGKSSFSRESIWRLCKNSIPEGCLVSQEALPSVALMVEAEMGKILRLSLEGVKDHKTLKAEDLSRGINKYHKLWTRDNVEWLVRDLSTMVDRLQTLHKTLDMEVRQ